MVLLVSYDLKAPGRDYATLGHLLASVPHTRPLESVWLLKTNLAPSDWSQKIRAVIDTNDNFVVVDVTNSSRDGWLKSSAWDWWKMN